MKWKNLQMPKRIQQTGGGEDDRYGVFVIEPLERGFGETLGNAMRRVLLSSLQGAAISAVKIDGALHEFTTLPGVLEDTAQMVLNLKQIRVRHHGDGERKGFVKAEGENTITAGDIEVPADIEILNPEQVVATLNKDGRIEMEIEISPGRGYVSADQHVGHDRPIGVITIDSVFSPVTKVNFDVEQTRIGQRIDYDKLTMRVWTDGSILPHDSLSMASKILRDHFALLIDFKEDFKEEREVVVDEERGRLRALLNKSVDELELSVRSSNCLRAAKVRSIGDLVQRSEPEMLKQRNFGRKSLKEIEDILHDMGLHFGMDVTDVLGPREEQDELMGSPDIEDMAVEPMVEPVAEPMAEPTVEASAEASAEASVEASDGPSDESSTDPDLAPSDTPTT